MTATPVVISEADIEATLRVIRELESSSRIQDATALLRLVAQAEAVREQSLLLADLTPEDIAALERSDEDAMAGRVVPHEIVKQGRSAIEAYIRRRDAGEVDPTTAAAVEAYRRDRDAGR